MVTLSTNAYATYARRSSQAEQTLATSFNQHLHADLHLTSRALHAFAACPNVFIGLCYFYDSQKANRLPKDLFFLRR